MLRPPSAPRRLGAAPLGSFLHRCPFWGEVRTNGWPAFFAVSSIRNRGPQTAIGDHSDTQDPVPPLRLCGSWPWGPQWGEGGCGPWAPGGHWLEEGTGACAQHPSLSPPTCDSVPLAGLCEKGTWGPPETRARLELQATSFGRRPQVSSERVSGGVSKNKTIQRPSIINRMPRRA